MKLMKVGGILGLIIPLLGGLDLIFLLFYLMTFFHDETLGYANIFSILHIGVLLISLIFFVFFILGYDKLGRIKNSQYLKLGSIGNLCLIFVGVIFFILLTFLSGLSREDVGLSSGIFLVFFILTGFLLIVSSCAVNVFFALGLIKINEDFSKIVGIFWIITTFLLVGIIIPLLGFILFPFGILSFFVTLILASIFLLRISKKYE